MKKQSVTMVDVAKRAGVSSATVSLVLSRRPGRYSEQTAARVHKAAKDLGYVMNASARSLRTQRTQTIGFVSDAVTVTRFASGMVQGILDAAQTRGHLVMMVETGHDPHEIERAFTALRARQVDALLVGLMNSRHVELPASPGLVPVLINGTADGCPCVLPDEAAAGEEAVDYLVSRGHRRIAFVGHHAHQAPPEVSINIPVRLEAIERAMLKHGLQFTAVHHDTLWEPTTGRTGAHAVLDRAPDTTAILAANDRIAFGVYQALAERGLRVGSDVSVLSFDDEQLASMVVPGMTTIRLPYPEMGAAGTALALDSPGEAAPAQHPHPRTSPLLVPMRLVQRASVGSV